MPVILDQAAYDVWLDPGMANVSAASELLKLFPCPADALPSCEHADQFRGQRRRGMLTPGRGLGSSPPPLLISGGGYLITPMADQTMDDGIREMALRC
jgi:hypothetical protein